MNLPAWVLMCPRGPTTALSQGVPLLHCEKKALRDAIHGMEELKRAQEMRVDEFSLQKLRAGHVTIREITPQMKELQERVNCMNDSREFQDFESNYSGNVSHVSSQQAVIPSPRSMLSRD